MEKFTGSWEDLEKLINSKMGLTILVLSSPECSVCRRMKQHVPALLRENPDVNFIEVEYKEQNLGVFEALKLSNIPHFFFYKGTNRDGSPTELAHLIGFNLQDIRMKITQFI